MKQADHPPDQPTHAGLQPQAQRNYRPAVVLVVLGIAGRKIGSIAAPTATTSSGFAVSGGRRRARPPLPSTGMVDLLHHHHAQRILVALAPGVVHAGHGACGCVDQGFR